MLNKVKIKKGLNIIYNYMDDNNINSNLFKNNIKKVNNIIYLNLINKDFNIDLNLKVNINNNDYYKIFITFKNNNKSIYLLVNKDYYIIDFIIINKENIFNYI